MQGLVGFSKEFDFILSEERSLEGFDYMIWFMFQKVYFGF